MKNLKHKIEILLSLPKSYYVSMKLLGFRRALCLPFLVRYNTKIIDLDGKINLYGGQNKNRLWQN